jgi:hypothetical protein
MGPMRLRRRMPSAISARGAVTESEERAEFSRVTPPFTFGELPADSTNGSVEVEIEGVRARRCAHLLKCSTRRALAGCREAVMDRQDNEAPEASVRGLGRWGRSSYAASPSAPGISIPARS